MVANVGQMVIMQTNCHRACVSGTCGERGEGGEASEGGEGGEGSQWVQWSISKQRVLHI